MIPQAHFGRDLSISRLVGGCWQLAGEHGYVDGQQSKIELQKMLDAGVDTLEVATVDGKALKHVRPDH
jgi:aryl-alcohol dehydrogenase-like predicted oxidoreductase